MVLYVGDTIYYHGGVYIITDYLDGIYNRVTTISGDAGRLFSTRCYPYVHRDASAEFYIISRGNPHMVHHHLKPHSFLECVD